MIPHPIPPPLPAMSTQPQAGSWYFFNEKMLILLIGVLITQLNTFLPQYSPASLSIFDGTLPESISPVVIQFIVGTDFERVDPAIQRALVGLITRFPSTTTVQAWIHQDVWSRRFANHLPTLPSHIKHALVSISDFHREGSVLGHAKFDAFATDFTFTLTAVLPSSQLKMTMKGGVAHISLLFALHRALALVAFPSGGSLELTIDSSLITLGVWGRMLFARKILDTVMEIVSQAPHSQCQYIIQNLRIEVQTLFSRDEIRDFLSKVLSAAPRLQTLELRVKETNETNTLWTDLIRMLTDLRHLVHVELVFPRPLALLDADVAQCLRSWRDARYISLNPKPLTSLLSFGQPSLTLNALDGAAAHAPQSLTHLGLFLNADRISVQGFDVDTRSHGGVKELKLGFASDDVQHSRQVLARAGALFPNAQIDLV